MWYIYSCAIRLSLILFSFYLYDIHMQENYFDFVAARYEQASYI